LTVHDSILLEVPFDSVEKVATIVVPECMTHRAKAPKLGFTIACDVDVVQRWDEALYHEEFVEFGFKDEFANQFGKKDEKGNILRKE
jgi:hypothetical protein